ncbi:unnamed protein product [Microthlaspi erraticum]|uniref:Uncharacterized protein n=1 Tax=Microthlaspi erraticum TaxID=1685480 RepID=A0A6D2JCU8_9BRAS|nr:unnamed protein product [Microthlaspi erraticum]
MPDDIQPGGDDSNDGDNEEGDNEEDEHNHIPDPFIQQLNNQQPMPNYEEEYEPDQPQDHEGMDENADEGNSDSPDIAMTPLELMQRCETEAQAQRKRRFMNALVVDLIRDEEERLQASPTVHGEHFATQAAEALEVLTPPRENPLDEGGNLQEYGSFLEFDVLEALQSEPSKKKARLSGDKEAASSSYHLGNNDEPNALGKLQADYTDSGADSPDTTPQDRGAVGPVPPPVP